MTGTITPPIPVIGQPNSIEDPVVKESLEYIRDKINAVLASDNTVDPALFNTANKIKFKYYSPKIIVPEETRENTSFGFLTTEDKISNVVIPENGLILIWYRAVIKSSILSAGRAALFFDSEQVKYKGSVQETATLSPAGTYAQLTTWPAGLSTESGAFISSSEYEPIGTISNSGICTLAGPAKTATVGVKFKATSGSVTVGTRTLWVVTLG